MKVDMSPEAVSRRLSTMGELWELGISLSRSRSLDGSKMRRPRRRIAAIQDSIRRVLIDEWDPIGVRGVPEATDEYDSYIGRIYQILTESRSADELGEYLAKVEREQMGLSSSAQIRTDVATKLLELDVTLERNWL